MIRFFRQIRQRLLTENRFSKYLLYAVGEILLVVIGILIALQVDNWNEERKTRNLETIFLNDIHTEFKANKIQFERTLAGHLEQARRCDLIIDQFPITDNNWDSISRIYLLNPNTATRQTSDGSSLLEFVYTFNPSQGSLESLMSSSAFDIIKNEQLKDLLIAWKDLFLDYQENEERELAFIQDNLEPFGLEHIRYIKNKDDSFNIKLDPDRRYMFESLVRRRRHYLGLITEDPLKEVLKLRQTIDSIIEFTDQFTN